MTDKELHDLWLEYRIAKQCGSLLGALEDEAVEQDLKYRDTEYTPQTHPRDANITPLGRGKWIEAVEIPIWFTKEVSYQQYAITPETERNKPVAQFLKAQELKDDVRSKFWAAGRKRPKCKHCVTKIPSGTTKKDQFLS